MVSCIIYHAGTRVVTNRRERRARGRWVTQLGHFHPVLVACIANNMFDGHWSGESVLLDERTADIRWQQADDRCLPV